MINLYTVLGVDKSASQKEIEKGYRRQASLFHPDKGGNADKFGEVRKAFDTLNDLPKRVEYDLELSAFEREGDIEPSDTVALVTFEGDPEGHKLTCRCGGEYFISTSELDDIRSEADTNSVVVACDTCSLLINVTIQYNNMTAQVGYSTEPTYDPANPLQWVVDREGLVIIQKPDCCARQKFRIFDSHGAKRQVMRTDTKFSCTADCCPTDAAVYISGADGRETKTHKIVSSDSGCIHPLWKFQTDGGKQLASSSLRNGFCDVCGCPPPLQMKATTGKSTFYTKPKNEPKCCDGMMCPGTRYDFDVVRSSGSVAAKAAKLPLQTLSSYFLGMNNYSIEFSDPKTTTEERAAMITMILAADFHFWKPRGDSAS